MDLQLRTELGIGYYYYNDREQKVYIPLDPRRGQALEKWLTDHGFVWWKVMENVRF